MEARIFSIKKAIVKRVAAVLPDIDQTRYRDAPLEITAEQTPCIVINSDGPIEHNRLAGGSYECKARIMLDIYLTSKQYQGDHNQIDLMAENVVEAFIDDFTLGGSVNRIEVVKESKGRLFGQDSIRIIMIELEVTFMKPGPKQAFEVPATYDFEVEFANDR